MKKSKNGKISISLKTSGKFINYDVTWETIEKLNPIAIHTGLHRTKYDKVILLDVEADGIDIDVNSISSSLEDSLLSAVHRERNKK